MRVLSNTVPKSGSHMQMRLLELLGVPRFAKWRLDSSWAQERSFFTRLRIHTPGFGERIPLGKGVDVSSIFVRRLLRSMPDHTALFAHAEYSEALSEIVLEHGLRTLCLVRDPRDVVVSGAYFVMKLGKRNAVRLPRNQALRSLPDHDARILALLRGHPGTPSVEVRFRNFLGWKKHPDVCFLRFEDLVGPAGGGKHEVQREQIERVAAFLGLELDADALDEVQRQLYGGTKTFRKGTIGQWREEFKPEHYAAAASLEPILEELGYPLA